jgi:hypothetical protein
MIERDLVTINGLTMDIVQSIEMPLGHRIIYINPGYGGVENDLNLANHNIFRLDADNQVVWQVVRDEASNAPSEEVRLERERMVKEEWMPFISMGVKFFEYIDPNVPFGSSLDSRKTRVYDTYHPGCRLAMRSQAGAVLSSYQLLYELDPQTGIAYPTGEIERW